MQAAICMVAWHVVATFPDTPAPTAAIDSLIRGLSYPTQVRADLSPEEAVFCTALISVAVSLACMQLTQHPRETLSATLPSLAGVLAPALTSAMRQLAHGCSCSDVQARDELVLLSMRSMMAVQCLADCSDDSDDAYDLAWRTLTPQLFRNFNLLGEAHKLNENLKTCACSHIPAAP